MIINEAKIVNNILKGIAKNGKKKIFKNSVYDFNFNESQFEKLSPENQNIICEAVLVTDDDGIKNSFTNYLISTNILGNLSSNNIASLMEKKADNREKAYKVGEFIFEDISFAAQLPEDRPKIALSHIKQYVPDEKKLESIIRILPFLSDKEKLIAYSSIVPKQDRDKLKEYLGDLLSNENVVSVVNDMLDNMESMDKLKKEKYNNSDKWYGLFAEDVVDCFKQDLSMDEMTDMFKKKKDIFNNKWLDLLVKNSKLVSPNLLFCYTAEHYFNEEQSKIVIEDNLKRFDFYTHRESHLLSGLDSDAVQKFVEIGKTKKELLDIICQSPEGERFEKMKKAKDFLYNGSVFYVLYSLPDEQKEEALEYFKDHLTKSDIEHIYEHAMPEELVEERRKKRVEETGSTPKDDIIDLNNMISDMKKASGMGR